MSVNIYEPRVMVPALREIKPVRTFLLATFFAVSETFRTEKIDIDVQVEGRRVAPFVNKIGPAKLVERLGFSTSSVAPPCIAVKTAISAEDVEQRAMGEDLYEDRDPEQRARELLAKDLLDLTGMTTRRKEMMARDAIFTLNGNNSRVTAIGEDTSLTFDFPRLAGMQLGTLTGTDVWDNAASDPLVQIDRNCELYAKLTGMVVTDIIFGGDAYRAFVDNVKVKAKMVNTSLIQTGVVAPNGVPDGARLVATLYGGAVRIWTYHEWYDDPDNSGTTTEMVPAKKIMLASNQLRTELRYGGVRDLTSPDSNGVPTIRKIAELPRSWVDQETATRFVELRTRPLPVPIQNHFMTAQVLT